MQYFPLKDDSDKSQIIKEWQGRGLKISGLSHLQSELTCDGTWYAVKKDGLSDAIFDVRQAPGYLKNMRVLFAPDISFDENNPEYEEAEPIVEKMVSILAYIFTYYLRDIEDGQNSHFKIYSDHDEARLIFYEFCKFLKHEYPQRYNLKIYGKWIEIHLTGE